MSKPFAAIRFQGLGVRNSLVRHGVAMKWFLAGLGFGTALGMLIAPKSGAETRDELLDAAQNKLNDAREKVGPYVDQARERLEPVIQQARERVEPVVNQARERLEPVLNEARERVEPLVQQGREQLENLADRASDLKDRVARNGGLLAILNEWTHERLIEIDGIGPVLATKIIQNRPYESEEQLAELKTLPPSAIESLRKAA
jgi:DNA uptake protein ComE-like DNA-binding protein